MKRYSKALVNIGIAVIVFLGIVYLVPRLLMFFLPFVVGWIIAMLASPLVRFFEEKVKLQRKIGSAFVIVVVIALVVLLLYFACSWLFQQVVGLVNALPDMWAGMEADINRAGRSLNALLARLPGETQVKLDDLSAAIGNTVSGFFERNSTPTIEAAGNFAKQLPSVFIGLIMALLSAYFFVAEHQQIREWFRKHTPVAIQFYYDMIRRSLMKSVGGYLKAQLKIEVWMYLLLLIGMFILDVNYYALIALGIAVLDFLPFLGTGTVLIPWAVIKIFSADYQAAVGLLIIWCGGQLARQLIQPKIVGDSVGVPPIPTLLLLYVGYRLGGVLGMIVAVPLGLLVYTMYCEGAFDNVKDSVLILVAGLNRFRRLREEDMFEVEEMAVRSREAAHEAAARREEEERAKRAEKERRREARRQKKNKKNDR